MYKRQPFHQCGVSSLKLYQALEPETWGKLIGRVNGANFAAIYGGTIALGYRGVSLPKGHTWETYVDFLLKTLPEDLSLIHIWISLCKKEIPLTESLLH